MDYLERAKFLLGCLEKLAELRQDAELNEYIETLKVEEMNKFSLIIFIGTLTTYFSELSYFTKEEIEELGLVDDLDPLMWRHIKYEWAN